MLNIIGLGRDELTAIEPWQINRSLSGDEVVYIAKTLDACWEYDYQAAKEGRAGMHAILKCGMHSDIFFNAKIFLSYDSIREIVARQLVMRYWLQVSAERPDWVLGIPDGAKKLGEDVALMLKARPAAMEKENGRMSLKSRVRALESVLIIEDLCTRGTGLKEAVREIHSKQPRAYVIWSELAVIDRGGLGYVNVGTQEFSVISLARLKANDWLADECPLCQEGSRAIKPKATDENWRLITNSQR